MLDEHGGVVEVPAGDEDQEEREEEEVEEEEVELVDERGALEDDLVLVELELVELVQRLVADQGVAVDVLYRRQVFKRVAAQHYLEDVVAAHQGQLGHVLQLPAERYGVILLVELKVYLVLLRHLVQRLADQVLLEVDIGAIYQPAGFLVDGVIVAEVVLDVDAVAVLVDEDVPALHVVVVEENDLQVLLFPELDLVVGEAEGGSQRCDELRGVFEPYLDLVGVLVLGEGLDGDGKVVVEQVELAGGAGREYVRVVERHADWQLIDEVPIQHVGERDAHNAVLTQR